MLHLRFLLLLVFVFLLHTNLTPLIAQTLPAEAVELSATEEEMEEEDEEDEDFDDDFDDDLDLETEKIVNDPLSGYNRIMTNVNDQFYVWILDPVASGYKYVTPKPVRTGLDNFFENLLFPVRVINNVLQLKLQGAATETGRFAINTTIGLAGFFDPAKSWLDWQAYEEDFGQTLGYYGVGSGFHLVLPILGPSNLRDTIGLVVDYPLEPETYSINKEQEWIFKSIDTLNWTSLHLGEYENLKADALDFYPFLRDVYEQNRQKKIKQ